MRNTPIELWFIAVLVFESEVAGESGSGHDSGSIDMQYRLVRAVDAEDAYARALALGRREQVSYENGEGQTCRWVFVGLEDLRLVDDQQLRHGAEVYGFIEEGSASDRVVPKHSLTEFRTGPVAE